MIKFKDWIGIYNRLEWTVRKLVTNILDQSRLLMDQSRLFIDWNEVSDRLEWTIDILQWNTLNTVAVYSQTGVDNAYTGEKYLIDKSG